MPFPPPRDLPDPGMEPYLLQQQADSLPLRHLRSPKQCVGVRACPVTSNSLRPQGLYPWDFLSKNTRVGCHFLLQGILPTQGSNQRLLCLLWLIHWYFQSSWCRELIFRIWLSTHILFFFILGLPRWLSGKESACQAGDAGSVLALDRSLRDGNDNPLQYSCLENSTSRGAEQAKVLGVTKNQKWLSMFSWTHSMYSHLIWKRLNWWKCKSSFVFQRRSDSAESSSQKPCSSDSSMWAGGLFSRSLRDAGLWQQRHILGDKTPVSLEGGNTLLSRVVFAKPAVLRSHHITSSARALVGAVILLLEMERPTFREVFCLKIEREVAGSNSLCCLELVGVFPAWMCVWACGCSWIYSTWKPFLTSLLVLTSLWEILWVFHKP